jgi:uncharacterized protein (DUF1330 family)
MPRLDPTADQIDRLRKYPDEGPVVMVNLLKFRDESADGDGSGRDAYQRYSQGVIRLIKARGGTVLWAGDVQAAALGTDGDGDWDYVVLVQYPNRAAFIDMMTGDDYAAVNGHRLNGLARHSILVADETFSRIGGG